MAAGGTRKVVSAQRAAEILEISKMTVLRHYHAGKLLGYRTSRGRTAPAKIYADSIIAFARNEQGRDVTL